MHFTNNAGSGEAWAIILAGGDGTRLHCLTTDSSGDPVPKQFCYLNGRSLLGRTLRRAQAVVTPERIVPVVAANHARHWRSSFATLPATNIVVQPANRGTAIGILLPALRIARRDPNARIVVLPSDHYVADERVLEAALRLALTEIAVHSRGVALLGIEPDEPDDEPDTELGYIVPSRDADGNVSNVSRFVEKPPVELARRLCRQKALWNTFILVCRIESLVRLYLSRYPDAVARLQEADLDDYFSVKEAFKALPPVDFSRQIAAGQEQQLAVIRVPPCGWNDLGTPSRLAKTLSRQGMAIPVTAKRRSARGNVIDLAERLLRARPMGTAT